MKFLVIFCVVLTAVRADEVGGRTEVDPETAEGKEFALKVSKKFTEGQQNSQHHFVPKTVRQISKQVVSGLSWEIDIQFAKSTCKKDQVTPEEVTLERCPPRNNGRLMDCRMKIWDQPWTNKFEVTEKNCHPAGAIAGGKTGVEANSRRAKKIAFKAAKKFSETQTNDHHFVLESVNQLETQVVSGTMYHLKANFVESNCRRTEVSLEDVTQRRCRPNRRHGKRFSCEMKIWEQVWNEKFEITEKTCTELSGRRQRKKKNKKHQRRH